MKKHITRLLFAVLLLLALCIGASAAGTSGKCGPSAYWSFDSSTGTLTISGSGAMEDYELSGNRPWKDYRDSIQTVVIGDQITQIGQNAFSWSACSTIQFGKSVRSIGAEAFSGCRNLNGDLTIPDSVQTIGDSAFETCTGLTGTLTLGNGLQTIGFNAFYDCRFSGDVNRYVVHGIRVDRSDVFIGRFGIVGIRSRSKSGLPRGVRDTLFICLVGIDFEFNQ